MGSLQPPRQFERSVSALRRFDFSDMFLCSVFRNSCIRKFTTVFGSSLVYILTAREATLAP